MPGTLWILRLIVLSITLFSACLAIFISAAFVAGFQSSDFSYGGIVFSESTPAWPLVAIVVGVLTVFLVLPMMLIDCYRRGSVLSRIGVELRVFSFLWIFWLTTGALITANLKSIFKPVTEIGYPASCSGIHDFALEVAFLEDINVNKLSTYCRQQSDVQGFAFVNLTLLFLYTAILLYVVLFISRAREEQEHPSEMTARDFRFSSNPTSQTKNDEESAVAALATGGNIILLPPIKAAEVDTGIPVPLHTAVNTAQAHNLGMPSTQYTAVAEV